MADLGNSKIKDTYTLVLQTDASGNLQNLDGTTPSPFIFNSAFTYNVGTLVDGYVLTSDGSGNASWSEAGGTSYWSANTDGSITPSGLTTTIQTEGDLRVSGTVYTNNITTTAATTDELNIQSNVVNIKSHGGDVERMKVRDDMIQFYIDGVEAVNFSKTNSYYYFNVGGQDNDFRVDGPTDDNSFEIDVSANRVRMIKTVSIARAADIPNTLSDKYGLSVSGSSLFYSGGTSISGNAITAVGDISGTTDLYIDGNMYSGTTNLLDIFASSAITNQDVYWSANTFGIVNSGLTGNVGIGTTTPNKPLTVAGDISGTTNLYLGSATHTASTITAQESLSISGRGADNDYLYLAQDTIKFYLDGAEFATFISNTHPSEGGGVTFNASGQDYDFDILGDDGTPIFQLYGESGQNRIRIRDHLTIGKNDAISHADAVFWGLAVTGSSLFYSGGTSISGNAITAVGDISGSTNLHIDGDTHTTDLIIGDGGKVRPASSGGEVTFANADHGSADWFMLSQDLFEFKFNGISYVHIDPDDHIINASNRDQDFSLKTLSANFAIQTDAQYDLLALCSSGGTSIGGTTARWPTANGFTGTVPLRTLQVNGITTIYSGGTDMSWSADTTALTVIGDISGTTDLYIDGNMYSATTNLLEIFSTIGMSGTVTSVAISGSDGIDVDSGSPITDSGTIALGLSNVDATKIADGTVTDTEFQYINTLSSNAQNQLTNKLDLAGGTMDGAIAMSSSKITELGNPTAAQDAATKAYVDSGSYWSANTDGSISPSGTTTNVEIGGNFIADGSSSNDLDLRSGGTTRILFKSRGNQNSYIGDQYFTANLGIGTTRPNEKLTVVGTISGNTDLYIDGIIEASTITINSNLGVSGTTILTAGGTTFGPRPNLYWFANCDAATVGPASDGSFPSTNTTDVSWSVTHNSHASVYTWSAEELTITRAGLYKFTYNVTLEGGADGTTSNRIGGGVALLVNGAVVNGTESYTYNRISNIERNTGTTSVIYNVTADDVFKIVFIRTGAQTASSKLGTIIAGTAWTVEAVT